MLQANYEKKKKKKISTESNGMKCCSELQIKIKKNKILKYEGRKELFS